MQRDQSLLCVFSTLKKGHPEKSTMYSKSQDSQDTDGAPSIPGALWDINGLCTAFLSSPFGVKSNHNLLLSPF